MSKRIGAITTKSKKLDEWEIGYVLAILRIISFGKSVKKKQLSEIFFSRHLNWLLDKDLICLKSTSANKPKEVMVILTERNRPWRNISVEGKIEILRGINDEAE